ncbi:UDP-N-acetylmuramoyl-tripeptide--D-alanyl-D-alanine ligase [Parachlamydia acanthamoebae]|uniref:UDP-N-acetylmuramoyl-tripeptide--D-alanyl-D-alanine ligase n=2 Tax=Parachlamydia acanthamoebae TaxID=83552 RepID=F8KYA2_PARAV|nr:UDP-N-acetylmuramoyl-tripeptide--D-alanyl-D-alanine ligase [Parachlamydia acanthamoebae]CCB85837.1 UDP-N-acetylmuramoyl-tripeptide--D-alanyl-D-alanineligase [Parachlamydia acanthamoebae UV-7]
MSVNRLTFHEICQILNSPVFPAEIDSFTPSVVVDSRLLQKNDLFIALPGEKTDGHHFLNEVEKKGAAAAIVSNDFLRQNKTNFHMPILGVDDVLEALQKLAQEYLKQRQVKIVAITGSVGKTTTKHLLFQLLQKHFSVAFSPGNQNSQIGLPLSILNHYHGHEDVLILEMGMTAQGHIQKLIEIAPPDIAIVTALELVHVAGVHSLENIAHAKREILTHPKTMLGLIPSEIPFYALLHETGTCRKQSFSTLSIQADYCLHEQDQHLQIRDSQGLSPLLPRLPFLGKHNQHNFLAAISACRALGMTWSDIQQVIPTLTLPERRLEQVIKKGILFINDSYNAALTSVKAALDALPPPLQFSGKRIGVIGEMVELGTFSEACHREVGILSLAKLDLMICYGDGCLPIEEVWKKHNKPVHLTLTFEQVIAELKQHVLPGDVVLLKGSNKKQLWKVLEYF